MNTIRQLQEAVERSQALKAEMLVQAKALVKPALQSFMEENQEITCIHWRQYTPYFNDGDACVFSLHGVHFCTVLDEVADAEDGFEAWGDKNFHPEQIPDRLYGECRTLTKLLESMKDELEDIFGDHVKVIVTPTGVEVEEYEHD